MSLVCVSRVASDCVPLMLDRSHTRRQHTIHASAARFLVCPLLLPAMSAPVAAESAAASAAPAAAAAAAAPTTYPEHDLSLRLPHYHNLEWRLDVQLSSRMLRNQVSPVLLLELETRDAVDVSRKQLLQIDYANLDHLVKEIEHAVKEVNTKHSRRIMRYVK